MSANLDFMKQYLSNNPDKRIAILFSSAITLAYRNLYEQSDTGSILSPADFVELLMKGIEAASLEGAGSVLRAIAPSPSAITKAHLVDDFISTSVKTMLAEDKVNAEFKNLVDKLLRPKGPTP